MAKRAKRTSRKPARAGKTKPKRSKAEPSKRRAATKKKARGKAKPTSRPKARAAKKPAARKVARTTQAPAARKASRPRVSEVAPAKTPRLERARRRLDEADLPPSPPSSLDMVRRGTAARTGRAEMLESLREHSTMAPALAAGDADTNIENAYFSGDGTPGGDNSTPDQDIVDNIARAVGVEYDDAEELKGSDKVSARDKHRWELDPASSEDYRERK